MMLGMILWFGWMALEVLFVLAIVRWGFETGQWKDIEEPKYRMLIDHELQPWPGREKPKNEAPPGQAAEQ